MVVSLYVVGFCFMYNIHDVHLPISIPFFQVNNIIRTFHEYRNKFWSLILSVAERNITKVWFEQHTPKIVDVKKKGGNYSQKCFCT
jgi:hypothetical protein